MKLVLRDVKLGQSLQGRVEELLPSGELLISFSGDLLRVQNETRRPFQVGDTVTLIVKALNPLRFSLQPDRAEQRRRGRIDVTV